MKIEEMVEIEQLQSWLGYADQRSVVRWCEKRFLPILHFGLKRYVSSQLLTQYIDNQIVKFANATEDPTKICHLNDKRADQQKNESKLKGTYKPGNDTVSKYISKYEA